MIKEKPNEDWAARWGTFLSPHIQAAPTEAAELKARH